MTPLDTTHDHETEDASESLTIEPSAFDLSRHNAVITAYNPATGNHRTFKISTSQSGTRFVSLLTGQDNTSDYTAFAIVGSGAYDKVAFTFKKYKAAPGDPETQWEKLTKMVNHPEKYRRMGVEYTISARCRRCGRTLTTPASLEIGLGPECAKKIG
jgi:hypothetical protein